MAQPRWRRFLPDRSQLWVLAAVLFVMVAGVGFFNVFAAKAAALDSQRQAQARLDRLAAQNRLLQERVSQVQTGSQPGGDVEVRARQYFGLGYPGETRIIGQGVGPAVVAQPAPDVQAAPPITANAAGGSEPPPPFWETWWNALRAHLRLGAEAGLKAPA